MEKDEKDRLLREFRERINNISAAVQLLTPLVREQGSARDGEYLAAIRKSVYQMIRTLCHMELCGEETVLRPGPVDLAGLCRDLCRKLEGIASMLKVDFRWTLEQESLLGVADEELLEQALLNLLTNALEAAGPGGQVTLRCGGGNGHFRVTVGDDGPGLQAAGSEEEPFLWQPGGVGLGLKAARRAAALHGGTLMLENGEGKGVRAVLSLPLKKPEPGEVVRTSRTDRQGGFSPLLVELSPLLPLKAFGSEEQ